MSMFMTFQACHCMLVIHETACPCWQKTVIALLAANSIDGKDAIKTTLFSPNNRNMGFYRKIWGGPGPWKLGGGSKTSGGLPSREYPA